MEATEDNKSDSSDKIENLSNPDQEDLNEENLLSNPSPLNSIDT